jgi:hypothetical protein
MIHQFESTGQAYDACQCDENIKRGDLLLIVSERVVGIADTWPVAVTVNHGRLHIPADGWTLETCIGERCPNRVAKAKLLAEIFDYPTRD